MAPMYANAFMYESETKFILQNYTQQIIRYFRFINDILILWVGSKEEAVQFVHEEAVQFVHDLNDLPTQMRLTSTINEHSIQFLDIEIMIIDQKIEYKLYTKSTDCNTLLHFKSFHPQHLKQALPYSQFLRVLQNNSLLRDQQLQLMYETFRSRGYPRWTLDKALSRARTTFAPSLSVLQKPANIRSTFPMLFNTANPELTSTIRKNWNTLSSDPSLPEIFRQKLMICYRRNKILKDLLVQTDPRHCYSPVQKENTNLGCVRCLGCVTCGHLIPSKTFTHPYTGKIYKVKILFRAVEETEGNSY
ncbi:Hypothetical predicted protein [Pelobates cultripes]|uniref:Helix-turn-helix domain-containing protein n=1 Tax=Pelobates cultripes TaxID=61616 RepID=A0AAD1RSL6_PELCU|nr:Hypothetical predicted protein [Pelobates cultripes]